MKRFIPLRSIVDLCTHVDELEADEVGELSVVDHNDSVNGSVFVERGRVCWAAARGLSRRLSALLGERAGLGPLQMEEFYLACRREKRPLGEYLVERGALAPAEFRHALLQHTAESLNQLFAHPTRVVWAPRSAGDYNASFTFSTADVLAHALLQSHRDALASLDRGLGESFGEGEWGAAFVRTERRAAPDPIALYGAAPSASRVILSVGKWAASALDVTMTSQTEDSLVWIRSGARALVAFRCGPALVAGQSKEGGLARILNRRARRRREEGARHGGL